MARAVVILGAGASAPFGVPTLASLFKEPHARRHLAGDALLRDRLQNIFWGPRGCDLESSHLTVSVEDILTILRDYDAHTPPIPSLLGADRDAFRRSLYVLIKKAVYDGKNSRGKHLNAFLKYMRETYEATTWTSFNWDCIFESSFYYSSGNPMPPGDRYNPHLVFKVRNWNDGHTNQTYLKLHGGINWWFEDGGITYLPFGGGTDLNDRWAAYARGQGRGHPVILEPSCYKYQDPVFDLLEPQWDQFVRDLIAADLICIIGYSLPESDARARMAMTIGFQSGKVDARWFVINSDEGVCRRYARLFGTKNVKTFAIPLEEFSRDIPGHLALP
jgi:hypothetical protein